LGLLFFAYAKVIKQTTNTVHTCNSLYFIIEFTGV